MTPTSGTSSTTSATDAATPDVLDDLNALLGGARDAVKNYRSAAEDLRRRDIAAVLLDYAAHSEREAADLDAEIRRLGHEPEAGGRLLEKTLRAVQDAKSAVTGHDDTWTLSEIERGLDEAEKQYQRALRKPMPAPTRALLERLYAAIQPQHDRVIEFLRQDPGREAA